MSRNTTHHRAPVIYIDQPIGAGFSYGTDTVNSTESAAPFVWKAFQILFESHLFSEYASREYVPSLVQQYDIQSKHLGSSSQRRAMVVTMHPVS